MTLPIEEMACHMGERQFYDAKNAARMRAALINHPMVHHIFESLGLDEYQGKQLSADQRLRLLNELQRKRPDIFSFPQNVFEYSGDVGDETVESIAISRDERHCALGTAQGIIRIYHRNDAGHWSLQATFDMPPSRRHGRSVDGLMFVDDVHLELIAASYGGRSYTRRFTKYGLDGVDALEETGGWASRGAVYHCVNSGYAHFPPHSVRGRNPVWKEYSEEEGDIFRLLPQYLRWWTFTRAAQRQLSFCGTGSGEIHVVRESTHECFKLADLSDFEAGAAVTQLYVTPDEQWLIARTGHNYYYFNINDDGTLTRREERECYVPFGLKEEVLCTSFATNADFSCSYTYDSGAVVKWGLNEGLQLEQLLFILLVDHLRGRGEQQLASDLGIQLAHLRLLYFSLPPEYRREVIDPLMNREYVAQPADEDGEGGDGDA